DRIRAQAIAAGRGNRVQRGGAMNRREFLEMPGLALAAAPLIRRQRPLPKSEFDYVDWTWQRWREVTGEPRPSTPSDQTGHAELVELGDRSPSLTEKAWKTRRAAYRSILDVFLGAPPSDRTALNSQVVDEARTGNVVRRTVQYEVEPGERISAYLLLPA